ncbi:hypothetical protein [Pseudomonas syringae]|uniref:hypothetical protein n=1 Tax=Pseudomonas syringae TaxID=317 RepID=UPI003204DC53
MLIFEIIVPGTWLDHPDKEFAYNVDSLLRHMRSQFYEANLALNLFLQAQQECSTGLDREQRELDHQRRMIIRNTLEQELGVCNSADRWELLHFETEVRFKHEKWGEGAIPRGFKFNAPFLYARAFLYALDGFDKFLGVLAKSAGVPARVAELHKSMATTFPDLRGVRNSAQHMEDRSRLVGQYGKPLDLKPVDNEMIRAPAGALILGGLIGSKYGSTMAGGHYGEVDVSSESMRSLQGIISETMAAFPWQGPRQHAPDA